MEEDWDNDTDVKVQGEFCFDKKEFSFPNGSSEKHHRSRDHDSSRGGNRHRSGSNRSREDNRSKKSFEIQGNQIGAFIGKAGSNIRNYEEKFDVKLNLDKSSNTVTVSGEPSNISDAVEFIQNDLSNLQSRPRRDDFGSAPRRGDQDFGYSQRNDL